jgi:hypothetical protein
MYLPPSLPWRWHAARVLGCIVRRRGGRFDDQACARLPCLIWCRRGTRGRKGAGMTIIRGLRVRSSEHWQAGFDGDRPRVPQGTSGRARLARVIRHAACTASRDGDPGSIPPTQQLSCCHAGCSGDDWAVSPMPIGKRPSAAKRALSSKNMLTKAKRTNETLQ